MIPEKANEIPGVWGNLLSFHGGAHACIGYRFALVEYVTSALRRHRSLTPASIRMKALLFSLIKAFEFRMALPKDRIKAKSSIIQRPVVDGEDENRLPLIVTSYQRS